MAPALACPTRLGKASPALPPHFRTDFNLKCGQPRGGARMGGRGRAIQLAKKYDDPARQAVIKEWDSWASESLPTGYKATGDDETRFFGHMQKVCPHLLPDGTGDPWQTMHGWLLLERRVRSGATTHGSDAGDWVTRSIRRRGEPAFR
jgi:hypothetical protein